MKIFRNVEDFFFGAGGGGVCISSRPESVLAIKSLLNAAYLTTKSIAASTKRFRKILLCHRTIKTQFLTGLDCAASASVVVKIFSSG